MPEAPGPEALAAALRLLVRSRGELSTRFSGSSMLPSLPDGAELVLRQATAVGVGDIVAFEADGQIVLHRVEAISRRRGCLLTRGDALWLPDPPLRNLEDVLGVVTGVRTLQGLAPPPPARLGALRKAALWPFRAGLAASPGLVSAVLSVMRAARRAVRAAAGTLRAVGRRS